MHNVRRFREKRKCEENLEIVEIEDVTNFTNRMQKSRAMKKIKRALPQTLRKKAELLINLLTGKKSKQSPTMAKLRQMNIVKSPDEIENDEIAKHVLVDVKKVLTHTKAQRSKDSLVTKHIILAAVSGESVTENRCKKKLASKLEVPIRRLSGGKRIRTNVLRSEQSCTFFINHVRSILEIIGLNPSNYNGHSFRIGAATSVASKIEDHLIKILGRWSSKCYTRYSLTPKSTIKQAQLALISD